MAIVMEKRPTKVPGYEPVREPSRWLIAMGVATLLLGIAAVGLSVQTTLLSVVFLGGLSLLAAVFQGVFAFTSGRWSGFGLHLLLSVLYAIVGIYLVSNPLAGAAALSVALGMLFIISGTFRIVVSSVARFPSWGWSLFSGAVTAALGVYVLRNLSAVSLILLGTLFGVDMLFFGGYLMALGISLRRLARAQL